MGYRPRAATPWQAARARRHGPVPDGADRGRSAERLHGARVHPWVFRFVLSARIYAGFRAQFLESYYFSNIYTQSS